jgi:hypothetical protein
MAAGLHDAGMVVKVDFCGKSKEERVNSTWTQMRGWEVGRTRARLYRVRPLSIERWMNNHVDEHSPRNPPRRLIIPGAAGISFRKLACRAAISIQEARNLEVLDGKALAGELLT